MASNALVVVYSYHHNNTSLIANVIARILDARVVSPAEAISADFKQFDIVGFGSGIYDGKFHGSMLDLVKKLPRVDGKKAFLFSTCGIPASLASTEEIQKTMVKNHASINDALQSKGYNIIGEFCCCGFNTNSFLKYFGGINKGRPNAEDVERATAFTRELIW